MSYSYYFRHQTHLARILLPCSVRQFTPGLVSGVGPTLVSCNLEKKTLYKKTNKQTNKQKLQIAKFMKLLTIQECLIPLSVVPALKRLYWNAAIVAGIVLNHTRMTYLLNLVLFPIADEWLLGIQQHVHQLSCGIFHRWWSSQPGIQQQLPQLLHCCPWGQQRNELAESILQPSEFL